MPCPVCNDPAPGERHRGCRRVLAMLDAIGKASSGVQIDAIATVHWLRWRRIMMTPHDKLGFVIISGLLDSGPGIVEALPRELRTRQIVIAHSNGFEARTVGGANMDPKQSRSIAPVWIDVSDHRRNRMQASRKSSRYGLGRQRGNDAIFPGSNERERPYEGPWVMIKKMLAAALAIAVTTVTAGAQDASGVGGTGIGGGSGRHQKKEKTTTTETPKPKVDEKAYNAALKTIPDKPSDAWGGMR
jgi:hypothetical protein